MGSSHEFHLKNPNISHDREDILYHLSLGNKSHNLPEMFGDVKYVCLGGTPHRMEKFAHFILQEIGYKICPGTTLQDLSIQSHRYAMYKIGPVISVSHGMGVSSCNIVLHELIKLMYHAGVKNPLFFRLGTCGGIGVEPGSIIVSTEALNGELQPFHRMVVLGKEVLRPASLCQKLSREIIQLHESSDDFQIIGGKTISTDDFYEGQGRLDGAFCQYAEEDKFAFLNYVNSLGVTNIEMEAVGLAAITNHVGIKAAVICVTLLDRLKGDQISTPMKTLEEWQNRPLIIIARFIKKHLKENLEVMQKVPMCVSANKARKESETTTCSTTSDSQSTTSRSSSGSCPTQCSSITVANAEPFKHVFE